MAGAIQPADADRGGDWGDIEPALDEAIAELPAAQRDALVLKYFDGKSVREVAVHSDYRGRGETADLAGEVRLLRGALAARGVRVS